MHQRTTYGCYAHRSGGASWAGGMACVAATGTATGTSRWSSGQKQMQGKRQMPIILHVAGAVGSTVKLGHGLQGVAPHA